MRLPSSFLFRRAVPGLLALIASMALVACGGGGDGPGVTNLSASTAQYGRTMTVSVSGSKLGQGIRMSVDGGCGNVTAVPSYSDELRQFTCDVQALGPLVARIFDVADGRELGSLQLNIPLPQVEVAVIQGTRSGKFVVELDPVAAPKSVKNFLDYVNAGFYRLSIFHRVIQGFVVQAGGYTAGLTGVTLKSPTQPAIELESNNGLKNLRGTIAMARTDEPNSATSQWYINVADNPSLDYADAASPGYAVFGKVVSGLEVVDEIAIVPVQQNAALGLLHQPVTNVIITTATQVR